MDITISSLTVLFEDPFWIGIYKRENGGHFEVCKITFGAEPKDVQVYEFMLSNWSRLNFSPATKVERTAEKHINPKRMRRLISKQLAKNSGVGTKSQQALKLQQEQGKQQRKLFSREKREAEKEQQFKLRQEKRKEKHKGH